jgi:hypothetical protein
MEFPAGTEPGVYAFAFFKDGATTPDVEVNSMVPSCTVTLAAGEWVCTAQRYNADGDVPLGESASVEFIVPTAASVVIGVVGSVEVSVSESIKTVKSVTVKGK